VFDTIEHCILLRCLQSSYGFNGLALHWSSRISLDEHRLYIGALNSLPQHLSPVAFLKGQFSGQSCLLCTHHFSETSWTHGLSSHLFADDTQVYGRCSPDGMSDLAARVSACTDDVLSWMWSIRLQLNTDKTELIWCATSRRLHWLQSTSIRVGSETISPSSTVRDNGVCIDSDLSILSHVQWTVTDCFTALWQIRSVFHSLPPTMLKTLVVSLVLTRLDYGNATLAGIPSNLFCRLQAVLNASARTITSLPRSAHTSLAGLHWLRAAERIKFKLATLSYRCLHFAAPATCPLNLLLSLTLHHVGAFVYPPPTLYLFARRGSSLSVIGRFWLLLLNCETSFPLMLSLPCPWLLFVVSWKLVCFVYPDS